MNDELIQWRDKKHPWKRMAIRACVYCNIIFEHHEFSTVPSCSKCSTSWENEQPKDEPIIDRLMNLK